jgi:hypothetical protein
VHDGPPCEADWASFVSLGTALVVGNGLTLDLISRSDPSLLTNWHPSRPLSWDVTVDDGRQLQGCLPHFFVEVDTLLTDNPGADHFAVVDEVVRISEDRQRQADAMGYPAGNKAGYEAGRLDTEVRHFLGLAYSALDSELRRRRLPDDWPWLQYIESLGSSLLAVMSFNYETAIERTIAAADLPFFHCGVEAQAGAPLGKPHGSIDYAMSQQVVNIGQAPDYPINVAMRLIDAPMKMLPSSDLARPRLHVEVVPPLAASRIRRFQWVRPIFDAFRQLAPAIERCAFAGVSAWPVDQLELCDVLRVLDPRAEVVVANPDRRALLKIDFHVRRLGLRPATWWPSGP